MTVKDSVVLSIARSVSAAAFQPSLRVLESAAMFGLGLDDHRSIAVVPQTSVPLPFPGIVFLTGPSGGGKSTILSLIADGCATRDIPAIQLTDVSHAADDLPLIDSIGSSTAHAASLLSLAGLGDAFVMMRRTSELSDGQRARFALAKSIESAERLASSDRRAVILADEFAATLDRLTAKTIAANLRRWIVRGGTNCCFIAATTHDDLLESLQPDVLIFKGLGEELQVQEKTKVEKSKGETQPQGAIEDLRIEPGSLADYKSLASFHYRGSHPGAVTSILRIVSNQPTVVGRYLQRASQSQVVGVLVRSLPHLACRMRDLATNHRYTALGPRDSAVMLNREVRTISRVVIDPRFRGLGLAVKLVRHALTNPEVRTPPLLYTEALAAMGRVSPFFERAGMTRFDPPPRPEHERLLAALDRYNIPPATLASIALTNDRIAQLSAPNRTWLDREFRHWHRTAHRTPRKTLDAIPLNDLLHTAQRELLSQPIYYIQQHNSPISPLI